MSSPDTIGSSGKKPKIIATPTSAAINRIVPSMEVSPGFGGSLGSKILIESNRHHGLLFWIIADAQDHVGLKEAP